MVVPSLPLRHSSHSSLPGVFVTACHRLLTHNQTVEPRLLSSAKRLLINNTTTSGSLDNDRFAQAILNYRNTPIQDIGLSPAQILLQRTLRDFLPLDPSNYKLNPSWILAAGQRANALYNRHKRLAEAYNRTAQTLSHLYPGSTVLVQRKVGNHFRWDRIGTVVQSLEHRKYLIRMCGSGQVISRNRRFLKELPNPAIFPSSGVNTT